MEWGRGGVPEGRSWEEPPSLCENTMGRVPCGLFDPALPMGSGSRCPRSESETIRVVKA